MKIIGILICALILMGKSYCHEDGGDEGDDDDAPSTSVNEITCMTMMIQKAAPQMSRSPYHIHARITQAQPDLNSPMVPCLNVTLATHFPGVTFTGFLLEGRTLDSTPQIIGSFQLLANKNMDKLIDCPGGKNNAVTQATNDPKKSVSFIWFPPYGYSGIMTLKAAVVKDTNIFWVGLESPHFRIAENGGKQ